LALLAPAAYAQQSSEPATTAVSGQIEPGKYRIFFTFNQATECFVRKEKPQREQRPITVMINVTAADANSFRASQVQIAAEMASPLAKGVPVP
jgi:hypothetical protein